MGDVVIRFPAEKTDGVRAVNEKCAEIEILKPEEISPTALLAQVMNYPDLEGVVVMACINGTWRSCWSADCGIGGLATASLMLQRDVMAALEEDNDG